PPCVHTWGMSVTVSLSTRVSQDLRERLITEARGRGVPLSTLARDLLAAGLNGGAPNGRDGAVVNEVQCVFHGLPMEAGLRREVALALARTVEAGGSAGIAAGRELLDMVGVVVRLYEPEDWDEDEG
ncbi:MAG TPA: hypothetical protein VGJ54_19860, partial [Streptosporangiaceae bacterium]